METYLRIALEGERKSKAVWCHPDFFSEYKLNPKQGISSAIKNPGPTGNLEGLATD